MRLEAEVLQGPLFNRIQCRLVSPDTQFNTNGTGLRPIHFPLRPTLHPQKDRVHRDQHHSKRVIVVPVFYNSV